MRDIHKILKDHWGYDRFRPLQEEIIEAVLEGKDVLAIMPTGGGKSICFQVPALAKDGLCLVVSPLIALMKDQVANLKMKGIPALAIHSGMNYSEVRKTMENALHGNFKFLYVSPERLETNLFKEYLPALNINLIAVDESHCISQWGYDFRPSYLNIAAIRNEIRNVPVLAVTASATKRVQEDICEKLLFTNSSSFQLPYDRPSLSYSAFKVDVKINKVLEILQKTSGSAIVYCRSRKRTKEVAGLLNLHGISADYYHAGLAHEERNEKQESWIRNKIRVIVCTNAFGMGIDKPDVRVVVHVDLPDCVENYYQEAGRAGRDGNKSYAVLLHMENDLKELKQLSDIRYPDMESIRKVYQCLVNYLQIPSGSGEDIFYELDLDDFTKKFQLPLHMAMNAIKALEQDGALSYDEQLFLPSTVMFTAGRNSLIEFEKAYPSLEPYIKALLRSYSGILDMEVIIREKNLARMLKKEVSEIEKSLQQLHIANIIQYKPQSETPRLRFHYGRVAAQDLTIDMNYYAERRKAFEVRTESMLQYTMDGNNCRSQFIARYFNDVNSKDCGICDNCLQKKKSAINKKDFNNISNHILEALDNSSIPVKELLKNLDQFNSDHALKIIDYLIAEKKLEIDKSGKIRKSI